MMLHLLVLHSEGSSDQILFSKYTEKLNFHPYYIKKDLAFISIVLVIFLVIGCLIPDYLNEPAIYVPANSLEGIYVVPEWYFLPLFGFLKSVRSKTMGIILIVLFFLSLFLCPFFINFDGLFACPNNQLYYSFFALNIFISYIGLGIVAAQPLTDTMFIANQFMVMWYFLSFLGACLVENHKLYGYIYADEEKYLQ